jgi:hypothetical protein
VRIIEDLRGGKIIALPKPFIRWPVLLAIVDGGNPIANSWKKEFVWRLDSATVLAESTTFGAQRFLGLGESTGFAGSFWCISRAVLSEAGWRLMSLVIAPATRFLLPRKWDEQR